MLTAVTNRRLCPDDFFSRLKKIARAGVDAVILREKDLSPGAYAVMAQKCEEIVHPYDVEFILHTHTALAEALGLAVQLPLAAFLSLSSEEKARNEKIGVSVHTVEQAQLARQEGAARLVVGHIFDTSCKPGLPPRGVSFLREVCADVSIPIWAIGGIRPENIGDVMKVGAAGACVMSPLWTSDDPARLVETYRENATPRQGCLIV